MQGLVSCDLERADEQALLYGAMLTAKGMIECDLWIARLGERLILVMPAVGRDLVLATLQRSLPPRLARYADVSEELAAIRVVGPRAPHVAEAAGLQVPPTGKVVEHDGAFVARPTRDEPFVIQVLCPREAWERFMARLATAGARPAGPAALELTRVLDGWPLLGAEIDSKTLPQEVRFDDLGAVSYSKGCYVGQETVARLHFRGHVNRRLHGLVWTAPPDPAIVAIAYEDKKVGRVTSIVSLDESDRHFGLGIVRKEIAVGSMVVAAGTPALVSRLPLERDR